MPNRNYIITVDLTSPTLESSDLKEFIRDSNEFKAWWNHIPMVFLVRTALDAEQIADKLTPHTRGARFLVTEVYLGNSQGWLKSRAWDWIKRMTHRLDVAERKPATEPQA